MNQQPQQQQQNTVITIPGTNNTIQIPANFAGKLTELLTKRQLAVGAWLYNFPNESFIITSHLHASTLVTIKAKRFFFSNL
jgi:hypothetical protein